jgi:hypothetical protein
MLGASRFFSLAYIPKFFDELSNECQVDSLIYSIQLRLDGGCHVTCHFPAGIYARITFPRWFMEICATYSSLVNIQQQTVTVASSLYFYANGSSSIVVLNSCRIKDCSNYQEFTRHFLIPPRYVIYAMFDSKLIKVPLLVISQYATPVEERKEAEFCFIYGRE